MVLNQEPEGTAAQQVWQHIQSGAGLLATGGNAVAAWFKLKPMHRRVRWVAPEGDSPLFRNLGIIDAETRGTILSGANSGVTDSGAKAIVAAPVGSGFCIILPFEVSSVLGVTGSAPRQFYADTPRLPYDTVARTSRGDVRRLVGNSFRLLFAHQGLPYVHLSSVPGRDRSAFAFRVDTDFGPRKNLEAVARLGERVGMKFSWFVNVGAHKAHLDLFAGLVRQGHDIQLHCLRHTVYPDYKRNLDNFRAAKETMGEAGIVPCGVVAPFGEWSPNLNRAFEELGFEYSSEFCSAYDDLPFRPVVRGRLSRVLQVPVHPVCIGRLVAARASEKQIAAYFRKVVDLQVARQEPCILYDHPERIAQFEDLLADVLTYGKERCGSTTTMTSYARWWRRRERFIWDASVSGKVLKVTAEQEDRDLSVVAEQDGRYVLLPVRAGEHLLSDLNWQLLPEPVPFDQRVLQSRKSSVLLQARSLNRRVRKNLQGHRG
ncbi:hypothetical protein JXD38_07695 [candidate division WOR-3 bacterium]|nr:hypothetical protein [candidate division WOR-3 bacterium]